MRISDGSSDVCSSDLSDLEDILNNAEISEEELRRARDVRQFIVAHGLTKYNMEPRADTLWRRSGKTVILVPGQVEDDASIRFGCTDVRTNIALLKAARAAKPDALDRKSTSMNSSHYCASSMPSSA